MYKWLPSAPVASGWHGSLHGQRIRMVLSWPTTSPLLKLRQGGWHTFGRREQDLFSLWTSSTHFTLTSAASQLRPLDLDHQHLPASPLTKKVKFEWGFLCNMVWTSNIFTIWKPASQFFIWIHTSQLLWPNLSFIALQPSLLSIKTSGSGRWYSLGGLNHRGVVHLHRSFPGADFHVNCRIYFPIVVVYSCWLLHVHKLLLQVSLEQFIVQGTASI